MKVLEKICFLLFVTNVDSEQHRPCSFNALCTCSNGGPDLGSVSCHNIPFLTMPKHINKSAIYIMSLKHNQLRFLEDNSLNGTELWQLQINHNLLNFLPANALAGLEKTLSVLDLSNNHLVQIPREAMQNLQKLSHLILTDNHVTLLQNEDFRNIAKSLKQLDLSHNELIHIQPDTFRNMGALEVLNLGYNLILSLDELTFQYGLTNLKHIILKGNQLQQIPLSALSNLENIKIVNLDDNRITSISEGRETRNRIYLEELHLEKNFLTELTPQSFRFFAQINRLFLGGNPLTIVNDTFVTINATEIYMQHCKIASITSNAFYSVAHSLQVLDLSFNHLKYIPSLPFTKLNWLSLAGNEIQQLTQKNITSFSHTLKYLDIRGPKMMLFPNDLNAPNLREYLFNKKQLVIDKDYLMKLVTSMESLSITRSSIQTLESGIFHSVSSLKELDLSYNSITKIENDAFKDIRHALRKLILHQAFRMATLPYHALSVLTCLEYLDLSANHLAFIPKDSFKTFHNLKHLNLNFNKIKEIQPSFLSEIKNPNIETIKLAFNKIGEINSFTFRNLKQLTSLQLNDNFISVIKRSSFLDLKSLISIQLEGNLIETIENEAFQNLPNIQYINMAYNLLPNFNLEAFDQVGRLSTLKVTVSHNNIQNLTSDYTMQTTSNIKHLNFSYNSIALIDRNYFDPIRMSVVILDLDQNQLEDLTSSVFVNMAHLQILILSNNRIGSINDDEFKGIWAMQILNLSFNGITSLSEHLFQDQSKLRIFLASHNLIEQLPKDIFMNCELEQLDLSFNNLKEIPMDALIPLRSTLQYLDLSGNYIQSFKFDDFQPFQSLRHLSLSQNKLSVAIASQNIDLSNLIHLDISHNPIQNLTHFLQNVVSSSLETLNLANTSLEEIPFLNMTNIIFLNISSNSIKNIKQEAIEKLKKLQILDVSNNILSTTYGNIWSGLQSLRKLYLQNNPIISLSNASFDDMVRLQQLFIQNLTLEDIQSSVFHPLKALRKLEMNTYPQKKVHLSEMLNKNYGIQEIHLHVQEQELEDLFDENLPKSVNKIILEGENLKHIDESRFSKLRSQNFYLDIRKTNITRLTQNLFKNMNEVKNFTASFMNNQLQTIERMYLLHDKQIPNKFLKNVKLSDNKLYCNCHLSWIWEWMIEYEYENKCEMTTCEETYLEDLRDAKCFNINNKSIINAFKTDLDCFSNDANILTLESNIFMHLSILVIGIYFNSMKI